MPTFLDRFAFGLAASTVVWLTGGLEASIVLHAVNNVLVFILAGALGDGIATEEVPRAAVCCTCWSACCPWLRTSPWWRSGRHLRPETHTAALDLRAPGAPVPVAPADPPPGVGAIGSGPSGIVFCGAARCHPWGMG